MDRKSRQDRAISGAVLDRNSRAFYALDALAAFEESHPGELMTGAAIARRVEERSMHTRRFPRGGLYNVLHDLVHAKLIKPNSESGSRGPQYCVTAQGLNVLAASMEATSTPWAEGDPFPGSLAAFIIKRSMKSAGSGLLFEADVVHVSPRAVVPDWLTKNNTVVIKTPRPPVNTAIDAARYVRVNRVLKSEVATLLALRGLPHVVETGDWGSRQITLGASGRSNGIRVAATFIVQQRFPDSQRLSVYVRNRRAQGLPAVPPEKWSPWVEALARALAAVHNSETLHRDIRPSNIVIENDQPIFVDIGQGAFREVTGAQDRRRFYVAPEQRGDLPSPSRSADIFALGAVFMFMATGEDPDFCYTKDAALEAALVDALNKGGVLSSVFGVAALLSRCLRVTSQSRLRNADHLLNDLVALRQDHKADINVCLDRTKSAVARLNQRHDQVFMALASTALEEVNSQLDAMVTGVLTISGPVDYILGRLWTYLSTLNAGAEYLSISLPPFWRQINFGVRGLYFGANVELVQRGAGLRRLFLLTEADRSDKEVLEIVEAQLQMEDVIVQAAKNRPGLTVGIRYKMVEDSRREEYVLEEEHCGYWINGSSMVKLVPVYDSLKRIRTVVLRQINDWRQQQAIKNGFNREYATAKPLSRWAIKQMQSDVKHRDRLRDS
jgi:serine/threonine protein kinase